jgi:UDP-N-acetylglucosamine--dolichyl-phosphate N-acetylglucosaminephosphotransferase
MNLFPFLFAFILTFLATPFVSRFFFRKGVVGVDLHKDGNIKVPEMGGVAIFFSVLAVLIYYYFVGRANLLIPVFVLYIIGTLGVIDGFVRLSAAQKVVSFFVVGMFLSWGLGFRNIVPYLVIGFLFMAAVNFTNMLAGFNGLEIGTGAIASLGMAAVSYLAGADTSFIIASAMAGALLAFLYYNRYPATVFPGDVGTLIIGAALFSSALLGRFYIPGFLIFMPYLADAALKFLSAGVMTRESQKPTEFRDGKLYIPEKTNLSLARIFLKRTPLSEKEVVLRVWLVEALFVSMAVGYEVVA